jgi:hypothetical protein
MTTFEQPQQTRIDTCLMRLRRSLGELPPEEVNEILREIRSHLLDRAEASGELTDEKLARILILGLFGFLRWMLRYASRQHLPVLRVERVDQPVA